MKLLRIISTFILLSLVMMPVIVASVFQLQKGIIRYRMEVALEQQELVTITVEATKVRWHKKGKEIIVDGEFFDVKGVETRGQKIIFTGLFDKQEKALHKKLDTAFGKEQQGKSVAVAKLLLSPFYQNDHQIIFSHNQPVIHDYSLYSIGLVENVLTVPTPPPDFI